MARQVKGADRLGPMQEAKADGVPDAGAPAAAAKAATPAEP